MFDIVKLFWDNKIDVWDYKVIIDWGVVDGYYVFCWNFENNFNSVFVVFWILDIIVLLCNNSWFLCVVGVCCVLIFLE